MRMCFLETIEAMGKNKLTVSRGGLTFKPGSRLSRLFLTRPAPRPLCMMAVWSYGQRPRRRGVSKTVGEGESQALKLGPKKYLSPHVPNIKDIKARPNNPWTQRIGVEFWIYK